MKSTRASLLIRVRDPSDSVSWREFHDLYSPLIYRYARDRGLSHDDAEEIRSSCFETLVKTIRDFEYSATKGRFRAWLKRIVLNRVVDLKRKRPAIQLDTNELTGLPDKQLNLEQAFDQQWKLSHLSFCLERVRSKVSDTTYQVFEMLTDGESVDNVASKLGLNANQVYKAKSKVLQLVREQMKRIYGEEH